MTRRFLSIWLGVCLLTLSGFAQTATNTAALILSQGLSRIVEILQPSEARDRAFTATLRVIEAQGSMKALADKSLDVAFQAPNRLRLRAEFEGRAFSIGRDGEQLWIHAPAAKFGLIGSPDVPMFSGDPTSKDPRPMGALKLPTAEQLAVLPLVCNAAAMPEEAVDGANCKVVSATPKSEAVSALDLPEFTLKVWIREADKLPVRFSYEDSERGKLSLEIFKPAFHTNFAEANWKLSPGEGDKIETVARAHLTQFLTVTIESLSGKGLPTLAPATGKREVIAREGGARLEEIDGTRVLVLKGSPEEMGRQHGVLMKRQVQNLTKCVLYGVGVGSSFDKGRWFFGEIEDAQRRLNPFTDERYVREMDALAEAAGLRKQEVRLANFFPELFHCSGFAIFGKATEGGKMYHGRILDYIRGMGLEQNAAVIVMRPDKGNAWVNVGYAGFIGSVTAMNDKHVAIGEMGGRGEGNWDGKPMAQLIREVMEKASTLDEAVEIMRKGPRTCEYYYVISDAKTKTAVGIAATPKKFEVIKSGESHPQLPHPIPDAVLMSSDKRYEELARRVREGYGQFNEEKARDLMKRPVCMTSNIHSVLFEPDSLDFWVANADSKNPAAHTRYTKYNLAELLAGE
jgi:outer membrane lipoprotein-sorting protein